jgi:BMFP domain-containing protein YqiC
MKLNLLKKLASQLSEALPEHVSTLKSDFEKNCHNILLKTFAKFELVTREEFDTQTKVLARTRQKLTDLEAEIKKLEAHLKTKGDNLHKDD